MKPFRDRRGLGFFAASAVLTTLCGAASVGLGLCGPFTDVTDAGFCPFVLEVFTLAITTGTSPSTYDPASPVSRLQMAAFLSRTVDRTLQRGSRRAAIEQFWTTQAPANLGITTLSSSPNSVKSDGTNLWVPDTFSVLRVDGGTGKVMDSWSGATNAYGAVVGMGRVFVTDLANGKLYRIDPTQPAGALTTVATLGFGPYSVAYDGSRLWSGNLNSISVVTPTVSLPWTVTTITTGFSSPSSVIYDGANVWVADLDASSLLKLDNNGSILQTVTVGGGPVNPTFDGTNFWVLNASSGDGSVSVVRASTGAVLATLTGNGLDYPLGASFDGQRIMVVNYGGNSVSLWKAADLTAIGSFQLGAGAAPYGTCSDGVSFWIAMHGKSQLARF